MQVTIKITKWRVVLAIIMLILCNKVYKYCTQPFMFELFGSQEVAQKYFDEKYPVGSDGITLMQDIIKCGGRCSGSTINKWEWQMNPPKKDFEYYGMYGCPYNNDYISLDPLYNYASYIFVDSSNHIIKHFFYRLPKEYLP